MWARLLFHSTLTSLAVGDALVDTLLSKALRGNITNEELKRCSLHAEQDMPFVYKRFRRNIPPLESSVSKACERGAAHLYCETVLDVAEPWPFQEGCESTAERYNPETTGHQMELESEQDVRIAYILFMVNEVELAQQLLRYLGPSDSALVHVDAKGTNETFQAMQQWASEHTGIFVVQHWAINRVCYSAAAAVVDALELAVTQLPPWDLAIYLSPNDQPIRPRNELARYLWYHRVSYAQSDEGRRSRGGFMLGYECAGRCWDMMWRESLGSDDTIFLPRMGHPALIEAQGLPNCILMRRNFVEWLVQTRNIRGSQAWVLLRYAIRLFMNVERWLQTMLLNTEFCHAASFRHNLAFKHMEDGEQILHYGFDTTDRQAHSPRTLDMQDWITLQAARINYTSITNSDDDSIHAPAFVAFARKIISSELLETIKSGPLAESVQWHRHDWPLARRAWELIVPECPLSAADSLDVAVRGCGLENNRVPCTAFLVLSSRSCPQQVTLRERVAVSARRLYAIQVGAHLDEASQIFLSPGIIHVDDAMHVKAYWAARRNRDLDRPIPARVVYGGLHERSVLQVIPVPINFATQFVIQRMAKVPDNEVGSYFVGVEFIGNRSLVNLTVAPEAVTWRKFHVYRDAKEVTAEVLAQYFNWTIDLTTQAHD